MQLQASFGGLPLSALSRRGLAVYALVPSFRSRCPACGAARCAVRHGLYYRRVVDLEGKLIARLPVPRFRCRGGASWRSHTFSVLPRGVFPRRLLTLDLIERILALAAAGHSRRAVLDRLAAGDVAGTAALILDERCVRRACAKLRESFPLEESS